MATMKIVVQYPAGMPTSTQLRRFHKAVEQFYYARLFSEGPNYRGKAEAWKSWLKAGFHIGSMGHPPGAAATDHIIIDMIADDRSIELRAVSENRPALEKLNELLLSVESARISIGKKDEEARVAALLSNKRVDSQLIAPLKSCLKSAEVPAEGLAAYRAMAHRGLAALTHGEIEKVILSLD